MSESMTPLEQLTASLLAHLYQDEQTALAASDEPAWTAYRRPQDSTVGIPRSNRWIASDLTHEGATHVARHDPQRVLRQVRATRAALDEILSTPHNYCDQDNWYSCAQATYRSWGSHVTGPPGSGCSDPARTGRPCDCGTATSQLRQVRNLAAVYSDHPAPA